MHFDLYILLILLLHNSSAPEFDVSEIESLFSATPPKSGSGGKSGGRQKSAESKPEKIHLVMLFKQNWSYSLGHVWGD